MAHIYVGKGQVLYAMVDGNTVAILEPILHSHGIEDLSDLDKTNEPKKFPLILSEIVTNMIDALLSEPERTLSESTLKVLETDLLKITKSLYKLRKTALGDKYSLSTVRKLIDGARQKASAAINEFPKKNTGGHEHKDENVHQRIEYILQCRQVLEDASDKIEEFAAQDDFLASS